MIMLGFHSFVEGKRAPNSRTTREAAWLQANPAPIPAGGLTQLQSSCFTLHSTIPWSSSTSSIPDTRLVPGELLFTGAGGGPHLFKVEVMVPFCTGASTVK